MSIAPDKDDRPDPKKKKPSPFEGLAAYAGAYEGTKGGQKKMSNVPGKEQKINMAKAAAARLREKRR